MKNVNRILQTCLEKIKQVNQENIYNKEETLIWKSSERDVMIGESGNMDPKSELGVKKALHPPKTLHF